MVWYGTVFPVHEKCFTLCTFSKRGGVGGWRGSDGKGPVAMGRDENGGAKTGFLADILDFCRHFRTCAVVAVKATLISDDAWTSSLPTKRNSSKT